MVNQIDDNKNQTDNLTMKHNEELSYAYMNYGYYLTKNARGVMYSDEEEQYQTSDDEPTLSDIKQ